MWFSRQLVGFLRAVLVILLFCPPTFCTAGGPGLRVWCVNSWERLLRSAAAGKCAEASLVASRNEWESFQIAVRSNKKERILDIRAKDLKGPEGARISRKNIVLYRAHQLHITRGTSRNKDFVPGWYPDALIPFRHPLTGERLEGGRFQAVPFELPPDQTHTFWVDVYVPRGARPGLYRGACTVEFDSEKAFEIKIELRVLSFTLPERASLKTHFGSPAGRILRWYRRQVQQDRLKAVPDAELVYKVCAQLTTRHRINTFPPPELVQVRLSPDGSFSFGEQQLSKLKKFITRYQVNALSVPPPHRFFKDPAKDRERVFAYLKSWDKVLAALGEEDLLCCTYLIDEPNDKKAYAFTRKWGRLIRSAGTKVKVLVTEQTKPQNPEWGSLAGAVDIWVPLFSLFDPASAARRQKAGESIWTYTALCQGKPTPWWHIDFPLYHYRIPCWIAWRYGMEGLLYWGGLSYWNAIEDPWTDPATYPPPGRRGRYVFNGEGTLLYPAEVVGFPGAVPSMRLKALRDGIEDYEYFKALAQKGKRSEVEALVKSVTPSWYKWCKDPLRYEEVRRKLGTLLASGGGLKISAGKNAGGARSLRSEKPRSFLVIHADREKEPMPVYIYGQFIEHLGRCIYGGIWAEMLQDRKFFYPVGAPSSPWRILGGKTTLTMVTRGAYVGKHSPEVKLSGSPGGIAQGGLGLLGGRQYAGRIVVAAAKDLKGLELRLCWGKGGTERDVVRIGGLSGSFTTKTFLFKAQRDTDEGELQIVGIPRRGSSAWFRIGAVSLMPADNIKGMRRDTIALLRELGAPVYRWPGGNFVSGYNWKDGIGDLDKRPPRKNPAWKGVEHNDFGIDEFMTFCRLVGAEPVVVVNSGLGDAALAAQEVQYANGGKDTPMGKLRAVNGHPEPYKVKWWGIGNEMYGSWQLGHMPVEKYVKKHNLFARVMRKEDPSIKLIGVGAVGKWDEVMLKYCADAMDLISEHFYRGEKKDIVAHVRQIPDAIRAKAEAHRRYRRTIPALRGKDIRIAMDEWNYWYGPHIYGELGVRYHLKDALGIAAGINEYSRNTDIIAMANYAQTVNVIGCIKTNKTRAAFATTGLVLKLYRRHFGRIPLVIEGEAEPVDVACAWSEDRRSLTISVVNPLERAVTLRIRLKGAVLRGKGRKWVISHRDPMSYNEPGKEPRVVIREEAAGPFDGSLSVAPLSVTLFEFRRR